MELCGFMLDNTIRMLGNLVYSLFIFISLQAHAQQDSQCTNNSVQETMQQRKRSFKTFYKPGSPIQNLNFGSFELYDFKSEISLVLFWKTDCTYCKNLLEIVDSLLQQTTERQLTIVAVCLDTTIRTWQQHPFVKKHYPHLYTICDGQGYWGNIASICSVYGTPTMLLLDRDKRFLKLPSSVNDLKRIVLIETRNELLNGG